MGESDVGPMHVFTGWGRGRGRGRGKGGNDRGCYLVVVDIHGSFFALERGKDR